MIAHQHSGIIETMSELIVEHNANMLAMGFDNKTPFDSVPSGWWELFISYSIQTATN